MTAALVISASGFFSAESFAAEPEKSVTAYFYSSVGVEVDTEEGGKASLLVRSRNKPIALNEDISVIGQDIHFSSRKMSYSVDPVEFKISGGSFGIAPTRVATHAALGYKSARTSILGIKLGTEPEPYTDGAVVDTEMRLGTVSLVTIEGENDRMHGHSSVTLDHLSLGLQLANGPHSKKMLRSARITTGVRDVMVGEVLKCNPSDSSPLSLSQAEVFSQIDAHFKKGVYAQAELGIQSVSLTDIETQKKDVMKAKFVGASVGLKF